MQARLALVLLEQGVAAEAMRLAGDTLRHPHGSAVSRVPALLATATVAVRTGDPETGDRSWPSCTCSPGRTAKPQQLLPVALLSAEAAWTAGRSAEIVALTDEVWAACGSFEPWMVAELAWWRALGGATTTFRSTCPNRSR